MAHSARALLVALLAAHAVGCALFAEPIPTPARELTREQLEQPPRPPNERYYGMVFGAQRVPYLRPEFTHTFAVVVKATWRDGCPEPEVEHHIISWLPADLTLEVPDFTIQPPVNLGLHETLAWTLGTGQSVAMWGPYELRTSVYRRFRIQEEFLRSGVVGYQTVDTVGEAARTGLGCDCIHALTDMDPAYRRARYPLAFYGKPASALVVRAAARRDAFIDPWTTHDWLIPRLGLDQYPIERRPLPYLGLLPSSADGPMIGRMRRR